MKIGYTGELLRSYNNIIQIDLNEIEKRTDLDLIVVRAERYIPIKTSKNILYVLDKQELFINEPYILGDSINEEELLNELDNGNTAILDQITVKKAGCLNLKDVNTKEDLKLYITTLLNQVNTLKELRFEDFNRNIDLMSGNVLKLQEQITNLTELNKELKKQAEENKSQQQEINNQNSSYFNNYSKVKFDTYKIVRAGFSNKIFYFKDYGCQYLTSFCLAFRQYLGTVASGCKLIILTDGKHKRLGYSEINQNNIEFNDMAICSKPTNLFWTNLINDVKHGVPYIILDELNQDNLLLDGPSVRKIYGISSALDVDYYTVPLDKTIGANTDTFTKYVIPTIDNYRQIRRDKGNAIAFTMYLKNLADVFNAINNL